MGTDVIGLVVVTDGRWHYLEQALASLDQVAGIDGPKFLVNDAGTPCPIDTPDFGRLDHPVRRGLAASVNTGWEAAADAGCDYLFHLEEDFVVTDPIDLTDWAARIRDHWNLAQIVLKRQPWSPEERAAGGIVELDPDAYVHKDGLTFHRKIYSLNPHLVPRTVFRAGWPADNEAGMTSRLTAWGYRFAFYGAPTDPPRCRHIGEQRSGGWQP